MIAISANTCWYLYNFRKNTILALLDRNYDVIILAPKDNYSSKLEEMGCIFHHISIDQNGKNPIHDINTFYSLFQAYRNNDISIVLNFTPKNNIYSTLAAKLNNIKIINNIAGLGTLFVNENISSKIARSLYKYSQRYADKIFFQNNDDLSLFLNKKYVIKSQIDRIPGSGVDLSRFKYSYSLNDGKIKFLLIARLLYEKGITFYVDAARILKKKYGNKVEFCLLGFVYINNPSAITQSQINGWVAEGIIEYLGSSDSVEKEISNADCIVLPSFYREGVPKSLLEAGAMGKPIITTDNIGCKETVNHGINGYLCNPKDLPSLVSAIDNFINLSDDSKLQMSINSRRKIETEFDEKIVINKYLESIESLLQGVK